eukprot:1152118-Pelagomonas_calceolata.AAC.3
MWECGWATQSRESEELWACIAGHLRSMPTAAIKVKLKSFAMRNTSALRVCVACSSRFNLLIRWDPWQLCSWEHAMLITLDDQVLS